MPHSDRTAAFLTTYANPEQEKAYFIALDDRAHGHTPKFPEGTESWAEEDHRRKVHEFIKARATLVNAIEAIPSAKLVSVEKQLFENFYRRKRAAGIDSPITLDRFLTSLAAAINKTGPFDQPESKRLVYETAQDVISAT